MTIAEKLQLERSSKQAVLYLHQEGIFYRAYERSAFLFCQLVRPHYRVHSKYFRSLDETLLYVGFSVRMLPAYTALEKIALSKEEMENGIQYVIDSRYLTERVGRPAFERWRCQQLVQLRGQQQVAERIGSCATDRPHFGLVTNVTAGNAILKRLRDFPLEESTPEACVLLVEELQEELDQL